MVNVERQQPLYQQRRRTHGRDVVSKVSLTLDIPDDVVAAMPVAEADRQRFLLLEIACALYARDVLSLGRAAELAGMSKPDFGREIGRRSIARHYTEVELDADFAYARG